MDEDLIDDETIPLVRRSRLPGAGFFYPDSLDEERAERRAREAIEGAETVVVADTDADGLACVALIREVYDAALDVADFEASIADRLTDDEVAAALDADTDVDRQAAEPDSTEDAHDAEDAHAESPVALVGAGPHSLDRALGRVAEYADPDVDLYICDLSPDSYEFVAEPLEALAAGAASVTWYDHHQWDDDAAAAVRDLGVDLVVGESDEECTADVALRSLEHDFDERWAELAAVTRDHDLWLKEDPRSDDLADYAHWVSPEEYVTVVGTYGADLPETVESFLDQRRVEKENLVEQAIGRATFHEVGPWTVGLTYGRCSQNEVAEGLRERGADASVIVKPAGSASIRGSEGGFERAHEVAGKVNGGGHPQAAGCKPDIYDDMLDYAHHWTTEGQAAKRVILQAFEAVAEEAAAGTDAVADEDETAAEGETTADECE